MFLGNFLPPHFSDLLLLHYELDVLVPLEFLLLIFDKLDVWLLVLHPLRSNTPLEEQPDRQSDGRNNEGNGHQNENDGAAYYRQSELNGDLGQDEGSKE
eukprot:CAMPEP_0170498220 /NCGR_PEP_ID=MMETSP0208-20121228/27192_1 /TAXON_ID=197538 /ORGANISM="Strombidium inclinatum, Strain S3" /LENGTH=98 /DNA_ID=CAMNT_0010775339 /DNA_START=738 /DNA_END=1034 /DNA_ORIENTATION=-